MADVLVTNDETRFQFIVERLIRPMASDASSSVAGKDISVTAAPLERSEVATRSERHIKLIVDTDRAESACKPPCAPRSKRPALSSSPRMAAAPV